MSKLVELEETMTNATLFAVNKERDRIVRSFVENGFDLTKVSLKSFERVIKDKLWLAWQNAFAMGYEDEVQFGGVDVDVAEFADDPFSGKTDEDWRSLITSLEKAKPLLERYKRNPENEVVKNKLRELMTIVSPYVNESVESIKEKNPNYTITPYLKKVIAESKLFKNNAKGLLGNISDTVDTVKIAKISKPQQESIKKVAVNISDSKNLSDKKLRLSNLIGAYKQKTNDYVKVLKTGADSSNERSEIFKYNDRIESLLKTLKEDDYKTDPELKKLREQYLDNYLDPFSLMETKTGKVLTPIEQRRDLVSRIKQIQSSEGSKSKEQLKRVKDLQKRLDKLSYKEITKVADAYEDGSVITSADGGYLELKPMAVKANVLRRSQKDTLVNRRNAISFLNQTDFGRVYLENRLDYIARMYSGREIEGIEKRLTESVKDQSDAIIKENINRKTLIQRFFEQNGAMKYDLSTLVSTDEQLQRLSQPKSIGNNLPLSNQRFETTIKPPPTFSIKSKNIVDMIYDNIKNAMYPDKKTFQETARNILKRNPDERKEYERDDVFRIEENEKRNFGFINKNTITRQTLEKYRDFRKKELKDHFASGIQRVFVTEIHAAHHLGRLTYYHLNDVKLVKWQLDDKKNIDAPCDRCLYAGNNNSKRLVSILSYEAPSSWFEKKAKEIVNLSDSLDSIVTFAKKDEKLKQLEALAKDYERKVMSYTFGGRDMDDNEKNNYKKIVDAILKRKQELGFKTIQHNIPEHMRMLGIQNTLSKQIAPQSNLLSQTIESNKTEPTKTTQISQTKKNKNTSQKQSNNISQPTPTEKKPYKRVDVSQLKGIYFFDELLTDVNLSIPRHPYCRCRIVRLPYNEEQTLLALLGGEETVASAVSTGLGAASSLTMEEMIAAKETTKENRQWWTGLGKGAAIGAGILGAGFMMWYFIKTLKTPNKVTQGIGRVVKKGLMSVKDVAKAKEIEKITQEPLSKMPSKRAVKKAIEEGRDLTEETIKRLKGQEEVAKVAEEINPTALPELRNDVLLEPELQKVEIAVTYQTEKNKLDVLKKTLEDPNKEHTTVLQKLGRFELEDGKEFLTELGEQLIDGEEEQKEVKKAIQDDIDNITYDLEHTQFVNLPETKKQEILQGLKNYFDNLNEGNGFKVVNSKLTELDDVLNDIAKNEIFNIRNNDELRAIIRRNTKLMTPATYKKWKNKIEKVRNEIKQIDESLQYMRQYLPDEANELNVGEYVRNAIDEIVDNSSNPPLEAIGYKTLFDKYDDLMNKVEKVNLRLLNYRQRFSYESKTRDIVNDPFLDNLTGVKRNVALETAEKVLDSLKTTKPNERITVEKFSQINVDNVRYLANSYFEMLRNNPNWNKDLKALTIKATDLTNDAITKEIANFILVKEYNTKLSDSPSVNQRQLNRMRQVLMILLRSHIKRLRNLEFAGKYEAAEFSWRNMTLREACNIVQSRYSSFSTMSR